MFMYCSSLTHFFYNLKDFSIAKLIASEEKIITGVAWNPKNHAIFASVATNNTLYVWHIKEEKIERKVQLENGIPI